jgi:sporulation protein YlmC with PRC-barrel domain
MRTNLMLTTALALTLAAPPIALARDEDRTGSQGAPIQVERTQADAEVETTDAVSADDLIGRTVIGADGEALGEIDGILLSRSGEIERVVVGDGGVLGIGERQVTIPWSDTEASPDEDRVRVTMTAEDFQAAPEYERADGDNAFVGANEK